MKFVNFIGIFFPNYQTIFLKFAHFDSLNYAINVLKHIFQFSMCGSSKNKLSLLVVEKIAVLSSPIAQKLSFLA